MADNQLQVILKEQGVAGEQAKALLDAFGAPFEEAGQILSTYKTIIVTDENDTDAMQQARENRLALKRVRTGVENKRKELKADIVKSGKAIDSVAKFVKEVIAPAEDYLQLQEDFALIKAENEKRELIAKRTEELRLYVSDLSAYNLEMSEDLYITLLGDAKRRKAEADAEAKLLADKAEAAHKAELERQAAIAAENEKLKAEAIAREKILAQEREEAAKVRAAEQAKVDAQLAEERRIAAEERAKREKIEAEQRETWEAEAKRKLDAEAAETKAKADAEAAERAAQTAPDKDKLIAFANNLRDWQNTMQIDPSTEEAAKILETANTHLLKVIDFVNQKASEL